MRLSGLLVSLVLVLSSLQAIASVGDTTRQARLIRKSSLIPIPVVYYTPETRFAGGLAALFTFRFRGQADTERPSQLTLGFAYTQENQLLLYLPFQIFSKNQTWQFNGELGYYKYVYHFYGIGNDTRQEDKETYDVDFPRVRLNALRIVAPRHYLGLRYWWDDYRITRIEEGKALDGNDIVGKHGGVISGAGLVWNYDSRDHLFFPTRGQWVEVEAFFNTKLLGSDFDFSRYSVDAVAYFSKNERHVWALNGWLVHLRGEVPFQQLAFIGGPKKMRGYFEGRFRDKNLWMLQAEYRTWLKGPLGAAFFGGMGGVAPNPSDIFHRKIHLTAGLGLRLRLSKRDLINLRLDVASNESGQVFPYLTVKEAF